MKYIMNYIINYIYELCLLTMSINYIMNTIYELQYELSTFMKYIYEIYLLDFLCVYFQSVIRPVISVGIPHLRYKREGRGAEGVHNISGLVR